MQQEVPAANNVGVRSIDNSNLSVDDGSSRPVGGGGFLKAPSNLPAGVLEGSEPPPAISPVPTMVAAVSGGSVMVQVGALSNAERAQSWQQQLSQQFGVPGKVSASGSVYRVQLGPFDNRQQAAQLQQRLTSEAQQQSFITAAP
jgi:rare lipoprotein A